MQLYNTLSRRKEEVVAFTQEQPQKIGLYACGPTVYDYTHLGHLRKYTMDDLLVRVLRDQGFEVHFVQNITDVGHLASDGDTGEDKLEKGAKKYNKSVWEVAQEFEAYFWHSMKLMNILPPDISCRATEHISQQLEMVKTLEKKGFTYVIEGDGVYFDTAKFPEYGKMAKLDLEMQKAGARLEVVEGKRNPTDFALWKFERPGENRAMVWPSPWAERSFPGWHIECSAMACHYLGEQFEIHTGGIDHIPVHHTNEIAQAEAAFEKNPFVKYWVHHNFLQIEGEKMSKSLGNFYTIDDVVKRGYDPMALRLLFLTTQYRSEMNFTWENLAGSQKAYEKLVGQVRELQSSVPQKGAKSASASSSETQEHQTQEHQAEFIKALTNDLDTPGALSVLWSVSKDKTLSDSQKLELLTSFDQLLGLQVVQAAQKPAHSSQSLPPAIQALVDERAQARVAKNWQLADELRDQLLAQGYQVKDSGDGQLVTPLASH